MPRPPSRGTAAAISSGRPPRPCAGSWSKTPGASVVIATAADSGRVDLDQIDLADDEASGELLALNEAPDRLAQEEPVIAQLVNLRYFAGLTIEQSAAALDLSVRTANRHWAYARAGSISS